MRRIARVNANQRHRREERQSDQFRSKQPDLCFCVEFDADYADPSHRGNEKNSDDRDCERRRRIDADKQKEIETCDLREIRHDDHVRDDDRPAADPAEPWAHSPRDPRERCTAIRVCSIHPVVRSSDQKHRDERRDHDHRSVDPNTNNRDDQPK